MAKFESKKIGKKEYLFIDGHRVLKGWESFSGWYWFATELVRVQDSDMGNGKVIKNDKIWFGYVQGIEEEWGEFSQGEIESLGKYKVWELPQKALSYSGRRH
jgi:hypothetical protein